ncbi:hypothetical protein [Pseudodesulfovibrio sp.]|uniref:hypothetical protein n=1 Tax=unclassified Pseudodesulfovibrio TaxID=2661612 RepID=UPI003AFFC152
MTRTKSAIIVFVVVAGAIVTALYLDYTDTYVAGRFHKAMDAGRFESGVPFSLDAFLEYYDWEGVCICTSDASCPKLRTRMGRPYTLDGGDGTWSLIFMKSYYVVAEVPIEREMLKTPPDLAGHCFERWAAIAVITDMDNGREFSFVGD